MWLSLGRPAGERYWLSFPEHLCRTFRGLRTGVRLLTTLIPQHFTIFARYRAPSFSLVHKARHHALEHLHQCSRSGTTNSEKPHFRHTVSSGKTHTIGLSKPC